MAMEGTAAGTNRISGGEKELEDLKEKNYRLHLKIDSLKQTHATEIEYLKDELQAKLVEAKSQEDKLKMEIKQKESDFLERISSIADENHHLRDGSNVLKGQVDQLKGTVEHFKSLQIDRNGWSEQFEALKISHDQVNIELKSTRQLLEVQQSRVHELTQLLDRKKEVVNEFREEIESKDQCISQLQSRMRAVEEEHQEDIMNLQQNIMMQHQVDEDINDPSKRGNSLFSEVEERRVRVESELTKLRERVARLTSENVELQTNIEKGDCRSAIIVSQLQLIQKSENDFIQELRQLKTETFQMYEMYRDKFDALRSEYKKKLSLYRSGVSDPQLGEVETLRQDRDNLLSENMAIRRELQDIKKDLKHSILQRTECEANIKIYRVKLLAAQDLQRKSDPVSKSKLRNRSRNSSDNSCSPPVRSPVNVKLNGNNVDNDNLLYKNNLGELKQNSKVQPGNGVEPSESSLSSTLHNGHSKPKEIAECSQQ